MTMPVTYVEINSPDLDRSAAFFADVFDWQLRPFADPGYLVAPAGDGPGIDTGLMTSADGAPRSIPIIRVPSLDGSGRASSGPVAPSSSNRSRSRASVAAATSSIRPGVLIGLHEYDPDAS